MGIEIPWIGHTYGMTYHALGLSEAGFDVVKARDMSSGLSILRAKQYPLLLVQDWLPLGELKIPDSVSRDRPTELTQYFLKEIRLLPDYKQTPIIIPSVMGQHHTPEILLIDKNVELVDLAVRDTIDCLVQAVKRNMLTVKR